MIQSRTENAVRRFLREQRRADRLLIDAFVSAARRGDGEAFLRAMDGIDTNSLGRSAMKAVAGIHVPQDFRRRFLHVYTSSGDHIRQEVCDDAVYFDGLRALLPRYRRGGRILYRGDSALNRRRRSYGPGWTSDIEVARAHANGFWRTFQGGSVVLCTRAPAAAIICAPGLLGDDYGESEFVVDRRKLGAVQVVEEFSQIPVRTAEIAGGRPVPPPGG